MDKNGRDLRELVFGDDLARTPEAELQAINEHPESQDELNRLLELRETLLSLEDEDPPRRTVLVGAPVATPVAWWKRIAGFGSPGWNFAGALALAVAVLAHGWMARPAGEEFTARELALQTPVAVTQPVALDANAVNARIDAAVEERLAAAIVRVKADLRQEHQQETKRLVNAAEQRLEREHNNEMYQMREAVAFIQKKYGRQMVANVAFMGERQ
ncbi:MAG: hypothetical protein IT169_02155 [Bryobacterales bacterium]|nr:hypothetical protein [Bryobacterales bacterium]